MSAIETLEICFTAQLNGLDIQLEQLGAGFRSVRSAEEEAVRGARTMASGVSNALNGMVTGANATMHSLHTVISAGWRSIGSDGAARSAGLMLAQGFAAGIRAGQSSVLAAVAQLAEAAIAGMRQKLGIHSPSVVAAELGSFFTEGFAQGIDASAALVTRSAHTLSEAASEGLSTVEIDRAREAGTAFSSASEQSTQTQITVPIYVDGMRLGEACIRGINAVTRATGRLMLDL